LEKSGGLKYKFSSRRITGEETERKCKVKGGENCGFVEDGGRF